MAYKFFVVPFSQYELGERELNAFLRGRRVVSVEKKWIERGENSSWSFCVEYLDSPAVVGGGRGAPSSAGGRVDYREILGPKEFAIFARLRQWRKERSEQESIPVYTIFTNEQLAQMARRGMKTRGELESIEGIGDGRLDRFGASVLEFLKDLVGPDVEPPGPALRGDRHVRESPGGVLEGREGPP